MNEGDMMVLAGAIFWALISLARIAGHSARTADALERIAQAAERRR